MKIAQSKNFAGRQHFNKQYLISYASLYIEHETNYWFMEFGRRKLRPI